VATGNAELGFVAASQLLKSGPAPQGSRWEVPSSMHPAILQDAILLSAAADKPAASAFLDFLVSPGARRIIERHGYGTL
jgi:molybdate transport system substrate-binding protein